MPKNFSLHRAAACCAALLALAAPAAAAVPNTSSEPELLAVLQSDAPPADRAMVCKLLAVHGTNESVSELAKLLPDPQLASWARIALEAIPGEEADDALRHAVSLLEGNLLIGVINSIGVRRDAGAIALLSSRLAYEDPEVAAAAAVALGRIGGSASSALQAALDDPRAEVRSAAAEGCVLCAEQQWAEGNTSVALTLYDAVREADVHPQRILEATRGAVLVRGDDGIPLLMEQFSSPDRSRLRLALGVAREFPGGAVDAALAEEVAKASPDRAALILGAMADRPQTVVLSAVLAAAEEGTPQVRLAAVQALARVGDATALPVLLHAATADDEDLAESATATLAALPGDDVDAQIVSRLDAKDEPAYPVLLEVVGRRRIDAVPALVEALHSDDAAVRAAALTALGETVSLDNLSVLISQVLDPQHDADAAAARKALLTASVRMPDREAAGAALSAAVAGADAEATKIALLEVLGSVGGVEALAAVNAAAASDSPELQDVGTRLLGEWMTADAAPVLLELSKSLQNDRYRARALRGYLRIARQFDIPEEERLAIARSALEVARQPGERRLVLEVLERHPSMATLKLAAELAQEEELHDEAARVARTIAERVGADRDDVRQVLQQADLSAE